MTSEGHDGLDEDDEVVREVDLVVCDFPGLFLAQLPLKAVYADPLTIQSARFKADNRVLELKVPLFRPEGSDTHGEMDGQRYSSTEVTPANSLGAGFISNNTMYIAPMDGIFQMRPNLKQFHDIKTDGIEISMDMDYDEDDEPEAIAPTASTSNGNMLQVQLKRKESERAQSARLQSYSFLKSQEEAEAWRNYTVHTIGSKESEGKFVEISSMAASLYPSET